MIIIGENAYFPCLVTSSTNGGVVGELLVGDEAYDE